MNRHWLRLVLWCVAAAALCGVGFAAEHFVAPNGTPQGDGTAERPWDLATALRPHPAIRPMDTVWLRKGLYRGNFASRIKGTVNAPVIIRAYPNERVVLDGAEDSRNGVLTLNGEWIWLWGIEIMNSNPIRSTDLPGTSTAGTRGTGLAVKGPNIKVINCIIHDTGTGVTFYRDAPDGEIYGTLLFNTGWRAPDRPHGPSMYTQNKDGWKAIRDNVFFNSMRHNMQLYGSSQTFLDNYLIQGNVNFNGRWLTGGAGPMRNIRFEENMFYGNTAEFGYINRKNENLSARGNYLPVPVSLLGWDRIEWRDNTHFRPGSANAPISIESHFPASLADSRFEGNRYLLSGETQNVASVVRVGEDQSKQSTYYAFGRWRSELNFDREGAIQVRQKNRPGEAKVFVRRNHYEPNRAHVVIYNWALEDEVDVNISVMSPAVGDRWKLINVQNPFIEEITGVYEGRPLSVPMNGWNSANPIGEDKPVRPATFPEFGVFVLVMERAKPAASRNGADASRPDAAPGAIITTEVKGLVSEPVIGEAAESPILLGGVAVHLRDSSGQEGWARLLAVSPDSVSYVAPEEFVVGPMTVTIHKDGETLDGGGIFLREVAPSLFTMDGKDRGPAVGYTSATPDSQAQALSSCRGSECSAVPVSLSGAGADPVITLFGTAFRRHQSGFRMAATLDSYPAELMSIAADEFYPGLDLIHVRIPRDTPQRGLLPLRVTLDDFDSNTVTISLQ